MFYLQVLEKEIRKKRFTKKNILVRCMYLTQGCAILLGKNFQGNYTKEVRMSAKSAEV